MLLLFIFLLIIILFRSVIIPVFIFVLYCAAVFTGIAAALVYAAYLSAADYLKTKYKKQNKLD